MANTTMNTFGNDRICVIPFDALNEFESVFALMDETYPKFLSLGFEAFMSFFCATIHTWCEDHHIDVREVIDQMRDLIHQEYEFEQAEKRKENF